MTLPILVDCDGVLADMTSAVLDLAAKAGIFKTEADIVDFSYAKSLGWNGVDEAITHATAQREFCYRLTSYSGARATLRKLEAAVGEQNVLICTSPWDALWASQRYSWLKDFGVPKSRVIMCSKKHLIPGLLIDDLPRNLEGRSQLYQFLVARPWNGYRGATFEAQAESAIEVWREGL